MKPFICCTITTDRDQNKPRTRNALSFHAKSAKQGAVASRPQPDQRRGCKQRHGSGVKWLPPKNNGSAIFMRDRTKRWQGAGVELHQQRPNSFVTRTPGINLPGVFVGPRHLPQPIEIHRELVRSTRRQPALRLPA